MKALHFVVLLALAALSGCAVSGPAAQGSHSDSAPQSPLGSPFSGVSRAARDWPLVLDRTDLSLGTTVLFDRVPNASEIHDLDSVLGIRHLVISLPGWPTDAALLEPLVQLNPETDALVILRGYPPSRAAAEVWNLIPARLRLIAVVEGPPPTVAMVSDLNSMRGLDRVIAEMDEPSRAGFERLQRPLSFRKIVR